MKLNVFDFTGDAKKEHKKRIKDVKKFLKDKFENPYAFGTRNISGSGLYKEMGWAYDFRPKLRKFLVKQHGSWTELFAPNKTLARKQFIGRVDKIVEIK